MYSTHTLSSHCYAPLLQVGDFTLEDVKSLTWQPGGQKPVTVQEAVQLVTADVDCVTLDVKTYQDG